MKSFDPNTDAKNFWEWHHTITNDEFLQALNLHGSERNALIKARAKQCDGHLEIFTEPTAHLELNLWIIHPRKGASRGLVIKRIDEKDLPKIFAFLEGARERNQVRFDGIDRDWRRHGKSISTNQR